MKKIVCVITLLFFAFFLAACKGSDKQTKDGISGATKSRYSELEINEYNGIKLDPSVGPRDNSISGIQKVDIANYTLNVTGLVRTPVTLTYKEVLMLQPYEKLVTLNCVEGWHATILWKGVLLSDIMKLAEPDNKANTVIFHSIDGYTTSLPLQLILDKKIILAYSSNKITLPPALGYPFIVVAEDKAGYKWARWVTEIELSENANYKGYWEQRGYPN
ncbi:MAG: molybdopterin-dependent oxidoreductase [Acidaminococcaceae bacterium]